MDKVNIKFRSDSFKLDHFVEMCGEVLRLESTGFSELFSGVFSPMILSLSELHPFLLGFKFWRTGSNRIFLLFPQIFLKHHFRILLFPLS